METIQELADLQRERDKEVTKLKRRIRQTITLFNFNELENIYIHIRDISSRFNAKIDDWTELLDENEEGEPIYPERGMPETRYTPGNEDLNRKTNVMKEVLTLTRDALIKFMVSLPAPKQLLLAEEASLPFLKNIDIIKKHTAAKATGANEEQGEEDDTNTVINDDDSGNDNEVPIINNPTGDNSEDPLVNAGGDNVVPTLPPSPRNSYGSSKSLRIGGKSHRAKKERINKLVFEL